MLRVSNLIASCFNTVGTLSQSDFIYLLLHQGAGVVVLRFQNYPEVLPKKPILKSDEYYKRSTGGKVFINDKFCFRQTHYNCGVGTL